MQTNMEVLYHFVIVCSIVDLVMGSLMEGSPASNSSRWSEAPHSMKNVSNEDISSIVKHSFSSKPSLFAGTSSTPNTTPTRETSSNTTPTSSLESTSSEMGTRSIANPKDIPNTKLLGNNTQSMDVNVNETSKLDTSSFVDGTLKVNSDVTVNSTVVPGVLKRSPMVVDITQTTPYSAVNTTASNRSAAFKPSDTDVTPRVQGYGQTQSQTKTVPNTPSERPDLRTMNISSEQRLMTDLLWRYENSVRPVYNSSKSVVVKLGLTLTQILDLDEKNQVLTTNVWLEVEWRDEKLVWDNSSYDGTKSIRIPCRQIWLPDIVLYNSVDDYTSGYMPSLAMVDADGRVFWGPVVRFRSSCKIDITYFPFDDQVCYLKLGSWAYNGFQVNSIKRSNSIDLSNYIDNGEWELIGVKVTRNSVFYNCCQEPFPDVMFYMRLRRRVKYYFMNIIIPCIILSFLCLAGFLLPPESGEKITLGLSVLLTITVFMLMVADKMPQTSESISLISIYLMVVLSMSCLSILFSVGILSIHHQRGKPHRCPDLIKYLVFSIIAPILCLKLTSYTNTRRRNIVREKPSHPKRSFPERPEVIHLDGTCDTAHEFEEEFESFMTEQSLPDLDLDLRTFQEKQNSVNELITWLHRKHRTETIEDLSFQEWRDVAFVLDRLLFVVFLVVTVVSTIGILSMRPEQALTGFADVQVQR